MNTSSLRDLRARYGPALDEEVQRQLSKRAEPAALYGMMRYQLGYVDSSFHSIPTTGGKRFRPMLCLLCCEGTGGAWQDALPAAAAIELLHNFSLIHDDIEDRDPVRHHRPTVWKIWGEPQAINTGDAMFALASVAVLETESSAETRLEISAGFQATSLSLTEGQCLDMQFESRLAVARHEYLDMIGRKTGSVIAFSCWSGSVVAGADASTREALRTFGRELGTAFQIQDDMLGIWGSPDATGKEVAVDLRNRKKTLPALMAFEEARPQERAILEDFFLFRSDTLQPVLAILDRIGAKMQSRQAVEQHLNAALEALNTGRLDHRHRWRLGEFARELTAL